MGLAGRCASLCIGGRRASFRVGKRGRYTEYSREVAAIETGVSLRLSVIRGGTGR